MNKNEQAIFMLNSLRELCYKAYPDKKMGFESVREFAKTLEKNDKEKMYEFIKKRNKFVNGYSMSIEFNQEDVKFLEKIIDIFIDKNQISLKEDETESLRKLTKDSIQD